MKFLVSETWSLVFWKPTRSITNIQIKAILFSISVQLRELRPRSRTRPRPPRRERRGATTGTKVTQKGQKGEMTHETPLRKPKTSFNQITSEQVLTPARRPPRPSRRRPRSPSPRGPTRRRCPRRPRCPRRRPANPPPPLPPPTRRTKPTREAGGSAASRSACNAKRREFNTTIHFSDFSPISFVLSWNIAEQICA